MPTPPETQAARPRRRLFRIMVVLLLVCALPVILYAPGCLGRMVGGKYDPPQAAGDTMPRDTPLRPVRVEQTLPHTCGLRAMEAAYTAYGLDPGVMDIRYRLGTDFAAVPTDPESTGTLHPDILRVLAQDGFATTVVDLEASDATQQLAGHLAEGQLALAVVYSSTYHWVLLAPGDDAEMLWLVDSLADHGAARDINSYVKDETLSITLIQPRDPFDDSPSRSAQHLLGTREMARTYDRQSERGE